MADWPYWGLLGGIFGFLGPLLVGVIGYFIRQTLEDLKSQSKAQADERARLETRLDSRLAEIAETVDAVELTSLKLRGEFFKELKELHNDFVPRRELMEIVRGMRETAELNASAAREAVSSNRRSTEEIAKKLDNILIALANRKET